MEHHTGNIGASTYFGLKVSALPMIVNPTGAAFRYRWKYADSSEWKFNGQSVEYTIANQTDCSASGVNQASTFTI